MFFGDMPKALDAIIGGWKTNGIWRISAGRPLAVTVGGCGTPLPTYGCQRPNITGKPERNGGSHVNWVNQYFANPDVFQVPDAYTLGDAPRALSDIRSKMIFSSDLSIEKEIPMAKLHEGYQCRRSTGGPDWIQSSNLQHGHARSVWRRYTRRWIWRFWSTLFTPTTSCARKAPDRRQPSRRTSTALRKPRSRKPPQRRPRLPRRSRLKDANLRPFWMTS